MRKVLFIFLFLILSIHTYSLTLSQIQLANEILDEIIQITYLETGKIDTCIDAIKTEWRLIDKINEILLQDKKYKKTRQLKQAIRVLYEKYICENGKYNPDEAYRVLKKLYNNLDLKNEDIQKICNMKTFSEYYKYLLDIYYEIILNEIQK